MEQELQQKFGLVDQVCQEDLLELAFHCIDITIVSMDHTSNFMGLTCDDLVVDEEQLLCEAGPAITYFEKENYLYFSFNSPASFKATYLNGNNGAEIGGYILEFNDTVYNCDPGTPLGCVNYYQTKLIVTNDLTYKNPDMLNLCYIQTTT